MFCKAPESNRDWLGAIEILLLLLLLYLICHGASGPKLAKLKEYFSIYNVIVTE